MLFTKFQWLTYESTQIVQRVHNRMPRCVVVQAQEGVGKAATDAKRKSTDEESDDETSPWLRCHLSDGIPAAHNTGGQDRKPGSAGW